jgi:beta-lactam-binding protein with PASTA domain
MRADAVTWIEPYNLRLVETWVPSTRPEGEVLQQRPESPGQVRCGDELELTLSDGTLVVVPAVAALPVERARSLIDGADLVVEAADADSDRAPGEVLQQSPEAGTEVPRGSTVRIAIATGLIVPDVTGLGLITALQRLQAFQVVPTVVESDLDKDVVSSQSPLGGTRAAAGSRVALDISAGPWLPAWLAWLLVAALLVLAAAAVRYLLPKLVRVSARLDADGSARTESEAVAEGPSLRVDARLERGTTRVLFPGEVA